MAAVLVFAAFRAPWAHGLGRRSTLQGLNTGHLVSTDDMTAQGFQHWGVGVDRTKGLDRLGKGDWILGLGLGVEPIAATMRLEIGLDLKNVRPTVARWRSQCPA